MKVWQKLGLLSLAIGGGWVIIGGLSLGASDQAVHPLLRHMADSTAAAWVQALGAIVAIFASARIAIDLSRAESKRRHISEVEARVRALSVMTSICFDATTALAQGVNAIGGGPAVTTAMGHEAMELERARDAIDRLPLATLDVPAGAVSSVLEIRSHIIRVHGVLLSVYGAAALGPIGARLVARSHEICSQMLRLSNEAAERLQSTKASQL